MPTIHIYFETMAGTHLLDAVEALRDAGSADALYDPLLRATDSEDLEGPDVDSARNIAEGRRVAHSRRALLFSAFAAEAYANDFLYEKWNGRQDRDALQKLSPVDKYALLSALSGSSKTLDRGAEPLQRIRWLFDRRNELVHARPEGARDLTWDPDNHNPLSTLPSPSSRWRRPLLG